MKPKSMKQERAPGTIVYNDAPKTHLLSPLFKFHPIGTDIRDSSFAAAWAAIAAAGGQRKVKVE